MRKLSFLCLILTGCAGVQPATPAKYLDVRAVAPSPCEKYYVLIFSSQDLLKSPRFTHTWVTAVRVSEQGAIVHHTISWMPATLNIHPFDTKLEPGVNLRLHDTITKVALANKEEIAMWGPYECRPAFFQRFVVQKQFMESGQMKYQCVDTIGEAGRTGQGCNCIHAITDMDPEHGRRQYPLTRYGWDAGLEITRRFREIGVFSDVRTHDFLIPALGLQSYPITRANNEDVLAPSRLPLVGKR
jgi:hypothetical protein